MDLKKIVRENIYNLTPYSCARTEFSGKASVWIDANESPYNNPYNRYPDPLQMELKRRIGQMRGVVADQIFLGVGRSTMWNIAALRLPTTSLSTFKKSLSKSTT